PALLAALFGNSPFLSRSLLHDLATARNLVTHGASAVFPDLLDELRRTMATEGDATRVMHALRAGRRRAALVIALADITGAWPIEQVTAALSDLADACVGLAVAHLLRRGAESGDLRLGTLEAPADDSGLVVIGMGKLGARELNYSSDVDLIVFYDPEKVDYH